MKYLLSVCIIVLGLGWVNTINVHAVPCSSPDNVAPNPPINLATQYINTTDEISSRWSWDKDNGPASCPNGVGYCEVTTNKSSNTDEICTNKRFGYRLKGTTTWTYTYDMYYKVSCSSRRGQTVAVEAVAIDADVVTPMTANVSVIASTAHVSCPANPPGECKATGCKKQGSVWKCDSVADACLAGYTCPAGFKTLAEQAFVLTSPPGTIPSNCTETPPSSSTYNCVYTSMCGVVFTPPPTGVTGGECKIESGVWKKINCSGRCPGPSGGAPTAGLCVACGAVNVDFGVCALQPNGSGEIFDSCCPGSVAQRDGTASGCTCQPTKDAVYRLFDLINGVMLPVVIILGIFLIVLKGYKIMTSQGDPTALQEGKEGLTSAIIGLIFVLMAVSILRVIIKALISGDTSPF